MKNYTKQWFAYCQTYITNHDIAYYPSEVLTNADIEITIDLSFLVPDRFLNVDVGRRPSADASYIWPKLFSEARFSAPILRTSFD